MYFKDKLDNSAKYIRPTSFLDMVKLTSAIVQYHILGIGGPLAMNVCSFSFEIPLPIISVGVL